jgi:hypothetical protein
VYCLSRLDDLVVVGGVAPLIGNIHLYTHPHIDVKLMAATRANYGGFSSGLTWSSDDEWLRFALEDFSGGVEIDDLSRAGEAEESDLLASLLLSNSYTSPIKRLKPHR